jgi:hypothetical protein
VAEKAGPLGPVLNLEGVVSGLVPSEQRGEHVWQFILEPTRGNPVPVELRGEKIYGVIKDGHRLALAAPTDLDQLEDTTLYPLRLKNLSTRGFVKVVRPGFGRKAIRLGIGTISEAWKTVVGALVGAALVAIGLKAGVDAVIVGGGLSVTALVVMEFLWLLVASVSFGLVYRRWRWEGGQFPTRRLIAGVILGAGFVASVWWVLA